MRAHGAQAGTVLLGLLGWALVTIALGDFLHRSLWCLSLGLLCLSLFGWRFAFTIARDGLYTLSRRTAK